MSYRKSGLIIFLTAAEFGCQKQAAEPPRYAIVRFENLSGDRSLDWTGRAASEILNYSLSAGIPGDGNLAGPVISSVALGRLAGTLGGRPAGTPGISGERDEALVAGANHLITGYVSRTNREVRLSSQDTDLRTGKTVKRVSVSAGTAFEAAGLLAKQFSPQAKPYLTIHEDVAREFFEAVELPIDEARRKIEAALKTDPDFGPGWLTMVRLSLAQSDRQGALRLIAEALHNNLDPLSAASLDSERAALNSDLKARIDAMRRVVALSTGDTVMMRLLAEAETADGQFAASAASWKKVTEVIPGDPGSWNSLGYVRAYAGDFAGGLAALKEYRRLRPNDANPLDSTGDVQYLAGQFKDAAASYKAAHAKDPNALRSGDLYKAAWAKFRAGDRSGADASFDQFRVARETQQDPLIPLIAANWQYLTGRKQDAAEALQKAVAAAANEQLRVEGALQLAVWSLFSGDRTLAARHLESAGPVKSISGAIIRFCVMPTAPPDEWRSRAARVMADPNAAGVRRLTLGYALLLDGKRSDAIAAWKEIVEKQPASDFFARAVYGKLIGKPVTQPLLPEPNGVNHFAAILDII